MLHVDLNHLTFGQALIIAFSIFCITIGAFLLAVLKGPAPIQDMVWDEEPCPSCGGVDECAEYCLGWVRTPQPHLRIEYGDAVRESEFVTGRKALPKAPHPSRVTPTGPDHVTGLQPEEQQIVDSEQALLSELRVHTDDWIREQAKQAGIDLPQREA